MTLSYDLDLGFWRSNFKKPYHSNKRVDWHGSKRMWVEFNSMSSPREGTCTVSQNVLSELTVSILSKFLHFLWKPFFTRSDTRPTQVGDMHPRPVTWPNLSHFFPGSDTRTTQVEDMDPWHDPIWAIWLAEVRKFHQHHDRISNHMPCNVWDEMGVITYPCWD